MKFSPSTVFVILLGIFVAFCTFSHVKRRYTEGMAQMEPVEIKRTTLNEPALPTMDTPDFEERIGHQDPRKKMNSIPPHMLPGNRVRNVEALTERKEIIGSDLGATGLILGETNQRGPTTSASVINQATLSDPPSRKEEKEMKKEMKKEEKEMKKEMKKEEKKQKEKEKVKEINKAVEKSAAISENNDGWWGDDNWWGGDDDWGSKGWFDDSTYENGGGYKEMESASKATTTSSYPPPLPQTCASSMYGCCPDGMTRRNIDGGNCTASKQANSQTSTLQPVQAMDMYPGVAASNTSTVLIPPPVGIATNAGAVCPEAPPCPACERCPEPAFDCKKVVNYDSVNNERFLPQAILSDFSSFGM